MDGGWKETMKREVKEQAPAGGSADLTVGRGDATEVRV